MPHPKSQSELGNQQSTQQIVIKEAHKHGPALHSGYQQTQQFSPAAVTGDGGRYYEELLRQNPGMLMARSNWSTASKGQESFLKPNCQIAYFQIISLVL